MKERIPNSTPEILKWKSRSLNDECWTYLSDHGGVAGGVLTGVEPRIAAFASARAPVLVQCARLDNGDHVRGCPVVYQIAGGPKRLIWYVDDHHFTSLEALRERLAWLERYLGLAALGPHIAKFLKLWILAVRFSHWSRTMAGLWNQVS